jgi:IclR family acetate operon transcriptional repressor
MRSVLTALRVLESVAERQPIGVSDLARDLGIPKTSAQRALLALNTAGWIRAAGGDTATRWILTPRALVVGSRTAGELQLTAVARPVMEKLRAQTDETINLMVPDGDDMVLVERLDSPQLVRSSYPLGMRAPMNACSNGKAVLSAARPEQLEAALQRALPVRTRATITTADDLRADLAAARERGYAINDRELSDDICAVAAPILAANALPVAALSVSVPAQRMAGDRWDDYGRLVSAAAEQVSATLCGRA